MRAIALLSLFAIALLGASCATVKEPEPTPEAAPRVLRHLVLIEFQDSAPQEKIREIEAAFVALKDQIPLVRDIEWGTDSSIEGLAKGFTHCFLLSFHSIADRDAYLTHPGHQEFVSLLKSAAKEVMVVDYWVR